MRHYETIYIVSPDLSDEDYLKVIDKFKAVIEKENGVVIQVDEWGKKKLAYDIKKFDKGSYVLFNYCSEPGRTSEFERLLKIDDRILKFQTVKLAEKVDPEALLRQVEEAKQKEGVSQGEGASQGQGEDQAGGSDKDEQKGSEEEVKNGV